MSHWYQVVHSGLKSLRHHFVVDIRFSGLYAKVISTVHLKTHDAGQRYRYKYVSSLVAEHRYLWLRDEIEFTISSSYPAATIKVRYADKERRALKALKSNGLEERSDPSYCVPSYVCRGAFNSAVLALA